MPFFETSATLFRQILDINLTAASLWHAKPAGLMKANGGGAIVNIASVSGQRGNVGRVAYGASKGGVITLTQVMACELSARRNKVELRDGTCSDRRWRACRGRLAAAYP